METMHMDRRSRRVLLALGIATAGGLMGFAAMAAESGGGHSGGGGGGGGGGA